MKSMSIYLLIYSSHDIMAREFRADKSRCHDTGWKRLLALGGWVTGEAEKAKR